MFIVQRSMQLYDRFKYTFKVALAMVITRSDGAV
jgi:hypothetical protein